MQTPSRQELLLMLSKLDKDSFGAAARAVFAYQKEHNPLLARLSAADFGLLPNGEGGWASEGLPGFLRGWAESPLERLPFLPISFFKARTVQSGDWQAQTFFTSSGTSGQAPSKHAVRDLSFYLENARRGFAERYGDPSEWAVLALLPSYLEREGSSLVAMADHFIRLSPFEESGFFLHDFGALRAALTRCREKGHKTLLLGVSFALLDFAAHSPMDLSWATVMETGGMKGRRREMTREELHQALADAFQLRQVHSEYGMTELFSQAYSPENGLFFPSKTIRALATEINDPFSPLPPGRVGVLNLIDLANMDTCAFVQTEDLGRVRPDGSFEVLGRLDASEWRGCNLMTYNE